MACAQCAVMVVQVTHAAVDLTSQARHAVELEAVTLRPALVRCVSIGLPDSSCLLSLGTVCGNGGASYVCGAGLYKSGSACGGTGSTDTQSCGGDCPCASPILCVGVCSIVFAVTISRRLHWWVGLQLRNWKVPKWNGLLGIRVKQHTDLRGCVVSILSDCCLGLLFAFALQCAVMEAQQQRTHAEPDFTHRVLSAPERERVTHRFAPVSRTSSMFIDWFFMSPVFAACNYKCATCTTSATNCVTCAGTNRGAAPTCACNAGFFDNGVANCAGKCVVHLDIRNSVVWCYLAWPGICRWFHTHTRACLCAAITCNAATAPANGVIVSYTNGQNWGSVVTFACNSGFYVSLGSTQATCQGTTLVGAWSASAPTCTGERARARAVPVREDGGADVLSLCLPPCCSTLILPA